MTLAAKVAARYTQTNLEKTARSVLSYTILNALEKVKLDTHLKSVVPITTTGSFSDGKELGENPEDIGYSFTVHYPLRAVTTFSFEVGLQPSEIELAIRGELDDDEGVSSEDIQGVLRGIATADIVSMFKAATPVLPDKSLRDGSGILAAIEAKLDVALRIKIEAYSHDGTEELAEYPNVAIRWDVRPVKQELVARGSGFRFNVLLRVEWDTKPNGWAFDSDLHNWPKPLWYSLSV